MPRSENNGDTNDAVSLFLADLQHHPVPPPERQAELAQRIAGGDAKARDEMVRCNLRLVVHWARRASGKGVDVTHPALKPWACGLVPQARVYQTK